MVLAVDTGSPTVSVALARDGDLLGHDRVDIGRSSRRLLPMIDSTLAQAGVAGADLSGLVALAGPGSFTGLRVGLATVLGLHQALGVPAAAVPTLPILARWVLLEGGSPARVFALVDVLRDEWACQELELISGGPEPGTEPGTHPGAAPGPRLRPCGEAERIPVPELLARVEGRLAEEAGDGSGDGGGEDEIWLVGFGVDSLEPRLDGALKRASAASRLRLCQPAGLASTAAAAASVSPPAWDPATLTAPLYFRPPATTQPKKHLPGGRRQPRGGGPRAAADEA